MRPDAPRKRRASMPLPVGKMRRFKANPAGNTGNLKKHDRRTGRLYARGAGGLCHRPFLGRFAQRCGHNVRLIPSDLREAVCQTSEERHSRCSGDRGCTTSEHALCRGQGLNIKPSGGVSNAPVLRAPSYRAHQCAAWTSWRIRDHRCSRTRQSHCGSGNSGR